MGFNSAFKGLRMYRTIRLLRLFVFVMLAGAAGQLCTVRCRAVSCDVELNAVDWIVKGLDTKL